MTLTSDQEELIRVALLTLRESDREELCENADEVKALYRRQELLTKRAAAINELLEGELK